MNNENDPLGQPDGSVGGNATPGVPATQSQHPLADNNFDVGAFLEVVKLTFKTALNTSILKALVALSGVSLLWGLFTGFVAAIDALMTQGFLSLILIPISLVLWPLFMLVGVAQYTLCRPLAHKMFDNSTEVGGIADVIKGIMGTIPMVLVTLLLVSFGSMITLCLAPITIFVLSQAPYLVAVRDRGVVDAIKESVERTKKHWHVLLMYFVPAIVIIPMVYGCMFGVTMAASVIPVVGVMVSSVLYWFFMLLIVVFFFIVANSAFMLIDELEGIDTIDRTA